MQDAKLRRLQEVKDIFDHELSLKRPSMKRATQKALSKGYPRSVVNEVIDFLILTDAVPQDTRRADAYLEEVAA